MTNDLIQITGARTHNLKNISLEIPKHCLVVFTGVSGSGKSSLLFETIYTEAQRQLVETFSSFSRARLPKLSRPQVDEIRNLSTPILIDQKKMGSNLRSTVGTATELATYIRLLFSRIGQPFLNLPSSAFSFNHPEGMCPDCLGLGKQMRISEDRFLDRSLSLREGAILHPYYKADSYMLKELLRYGIFDNDLPLEKWSRKDLDRLLYSEPIPLEKSTTGLTYNRFHEGIIRKLERAAVEKAEDEKDEEAQNERDRFLSWRICPSCGGTRLNDRARSVRIQGKTIDEVFKTEIRDLRSFFSGVSDPRGLSVPLVRKISFLLEKLDQIGVGYLTLERPVSTLSGGESQRVKMARQMDCELTDLLYILDEPSVGLHPRDTQKLIQVMEDLVSRGNSVFVVEHDPDIIRHATWAVDLGPAAGSRGGEVVYNGPARHLDASQGLTGQCLRRRLESSLPAPRSWNSGFRIEHATLNNLKDVSVTVPKGVLTVICGVAGSGKSSLIHGCFAAEHPEATVIDQLPIGRTSRGSVASYIGIFNHLRRLFSQTSGQDVSLFSYNARGACPKCQGRGFLSYEMSFLDSVRTCCDLCQGRRYNQQALEYRYHGLSIDMVLNLTVEEALDFFKRKEEKAITRSLGLLMEVGLGYIRIGQTLSSLSGGESQRLKIATGLRKEGMVYIMDEPTTGLHMNDITVLMEVVEKLVCGSNTVIIIEHNLDVIRRADWVIELGPGGGRDGGRVLFEGTPGQMAHSEASVTGRFL